MRTLTRFILILLCAAGLFAYDEHGRSSAPIEARRLKNPLSPAELKSIATEPIYNRECAGCHGEDGRAVTAAASRLATAPADLTNRLMESMRDGEIYWVVTHGSTSGMPAFQDKLSEPERWSLVSYVRDLRARKKAVEVARLGNYDWNLPPGFPLPLVPADNPMTAQKVELGRYLFYDKRLSLNQTQACATCHQQAKAFTDGRARGLGSTGQLHPRSPMSLVNVAYLPVLAWANPTLPDLEKQTLLPMFGDDPVELGMAGQEGTLLARLKADAGYLQLFSAAFPDAKDPFTIENVVRAIASFERTILSGDSPYDRYKRGDDPQAISDSARRGEELFFGDAVGCFHCHSGFNFTRSEDYFEKGFSEAEFINTGLYNVKGPVSYPEPNTGLYQFTKDPKNVGKFRAPTLRNIAMTAPYMHDGSVRTLEEAIDHYAAGGRTITRGEFAGVGSQNPNKSPLLRGFTVTPQEKKDLVAFLVSLTDEGVLTDPALSDPRAPIAPRPISTSQRKNAIIGQVVRVYPEDGAIEMLAPNSREFLVGRYEPLATLRPGDRITANVRRQNKDFVLEDIKVVRR